MMGFYSAAMRCASVVLFVASIVTVVAGGLTGLSAIKTMPAEILGMQSGYHYLVVQSVLAGVNNALLPFFGAALLWRIDRHWGQSSEKAE